MQVVAAPSFRIAGVSSVSLGDEGKAADLAGEDTVGRRGSVIIARLDQRYKLGF